MGFGFLHGKKSKQDEDLKEVKVGEDDKKQIGPMVKLPGMQDFQPIGPWQIKRIYSDDIGPRCLCLLDEVAELVEKTGIATQEGKEEDAIKQEIIMLVKSITQLGRSSGMHCILAPLDVNTWLPTPKGWNRLGDLRVGDEVFGPEMNAVKVLAVSEVKRPEHVYRLNLRLWCANSRNFAPVDGRKTMQVVADGQHYFPVLMNSVFGLGSVDRSLLHYGKMSMIEVLYEMKRGKNITIPAPSFAIYGHSNTMLRNGMLYLWHLSSVDVLPTCDTMCILVDHEEHQFVISDRWLLKEWLDEGHGMSEAPSFEWMAENCMLTYNTQRNDASIIPGVIQSNPLSIKTLVRIKRRI